MLENVVFWIVVGGVLLAVVVLGLLFDDLPSRLWQRLRERGATDLPGWVGPVQGPAVLPPGLDRLTFTCGARVADPDGTFIAGPPSAVGPGGGAVRARNLASGPAGPAWGVAVELAGPGGTRVLGMALPGEHVHLVVALTMPVDTGELHLTRSYESGAPGEPIGTGWRERRWRLRAGDPARLPAVLSPAVVEAVARTRMPGHETVHHVAGHGWWAVNRCGTDRRYVRRDLDTLAAVAAGLGR